METMKRTKCCWSECNNDATNTLSTSESKGCLEMCEECFDLYRKHSDAREKGFMEDTMGFVRKKLREVDKEIERIWSPSMERLNSDSNENKNKEVKR